LPSVKSVIPFGYDEDKNDPETFEEFLAKDFSVRHGRAIHVFPLASGEIIKSARLLQPPLVIADPHIHFWSPKTHPWVEKAPFQKTYLPEHYVKDARGFKVSKVVNIQADYAPYDNLGESNWLQDLTDKTGLPTAIIGFASLESVTAEKELSDQMQHRGFRGIRFMLDYHPTDAKLRQTSRGDWMSDKNWLKGLALMGKYRLVFDLQVLPGQLEDAAKLAKSFPRVQFVLNHAGFPLRGTTDFDAWKKGLSLLAENKNVVCKLSGFWQEKRNSIETIRPYVETTITIFGAERCMFASNFPVDKPNASMFHIWSTYEEIVDKMNLSASAKRALFHDNAVKFYKL